MGLFSGVKKFFGQVTGAEAARTARQAGRTQERAILRGLEEQRRQVGPALQDISRASLEAGRFLEPYQEWGGRSLRNLRQLAAGGDFPEYTPAEFEAPTAEALTESPAVQFRMQQAQRALERGAAARGGLLGGAHQRELARYMQGLASQEYESEFERRMREAQFREQQAQFAPQFAQQQIMGRAGLLGTLGGMGLEAAGQAANIRERLGAQKAGLRTGSGAAGAAALQSAGQARASGALGAAQARQQAMGGLTGLVGTLGGAYLGGPGGAALTRRLFGQGA